LKQEIIIRILDRASDFLDHDEIQQLQLIMHEELQYFNVEPECVALTVKNNIHDYVNLFLAAKKIDGLAISTLHNYWLILRKFAANMFKDVDKITDIDIRLYLNECSKRKIKNSTLGSIVTPLKSLFSWLTDQEYIPKNPMKNIKQTKPEKRVRKALSDEELERLRCACETPRENAIVEFMYSTGCRVSEVESVNIRDINWQKQSLMVIGKGDKEREVYLTARALLMLQNYLETRHDNNPALFVCSKGEHARMGVRSLQEIVKELGERAGLSKKIHPHILRHTLATHLIRSGVPLSVVQKILGHESCATTEIYAQIAQEDVQMAHRKHA
jgi:integrase/recombinase XerD